MRPHTHSPERAPGATEPETAGSTYECASEQKLDPRCLPVTLNGPPELGEQIASPSYTGEEHAIWKQLYTRQLQVLPKVASQPFLDGLDHMGFTPDRIPRLRDVDRLLHKRVGWRIARSPGLLHERDFFGLLAQRVFPCTDFIRPKHELDYTPAPDLFHDVFGHTPMITLPAFADFYQRLGQAALNANEADARRIERFYWFTVEFGLIRESGDLRVYGNGILSSWGEIQHCLSDKVRRVPFCAQQIEEREYDVWHFQDHLFVIESYEQLAEEFDRWAAHRELLG